jgi:hypothetical protein
MRINLNQLRDDLANSLRGTLLVTRPTLRCCNDEEAEAIATHVLRWLDSIPEQPLIRAEFNDRFREEFNRVAERAEQLEMRYGQIRGAITNLVEAQNNLDSIAKLSKWTFVTGVAE